MNELIASIFGSYGRIIIFFHILSASILIGSMITIRYIVHPILIGIDDEHTRFKKCIKILNRYVYFVVILMLIIASASLFMIIGFGFEYADPIVNSLIRVKEALWVFLAFNFVYAYIRLYQAKKLFGMREFFEVKENLSLILNYLIPLNIILAMIAVYIGVIIRGF